MHDGFRIHCFTLRSSRLSASRKTHNQQQQHSNTYRGLCYLLKESKSCTPTVRVKDWRAHQIIVIRILETVHQDMDNTTAEHASSNGDCKSKMEVIQNLKEDLQTDGFVRIPPAVFCLDSNSITSLKMAFSRLFDGTYETGIYPDEIHWRKGISREDATREICNGWKADRTVAKHVCSSEVGELACHLMGWTSSRLGQDDVLHKTPQSGPVGFHQDGAYISDNFVPTKNNCLTMWLALDDADSENGALQYAPGSHLWKDRIVVPTTTGNSSSSDRADTASLSFHVGEGQDHMTSLRQAAITAGIDPVRAVASVVTVPVKKGEMVVHHQDVWHGSGPNTSPIRHRRALVAHVLDGSVRWRSDKKPHYIYGRYYIQGEDVPRQDFFPFTYGNATTVPTKL